MLTISTTSFTHDGVQYIDTMLSVTGDAGVVLTRSVYNAATVQHSVAEQLRTLAAHIQVNGVTSLIEADK